MGCTSRMSKDAKHMQALHNRYLQKVSEIILTEFNISSI